MVSREYQEPSLSVIRFDGEVRTFEIDESGNKWTDPHSLGPDDAVLLG